MEKYDFRDFDYPFWEFLDTEIEHLTPNDRSNAAFLIEMLPKQPYNVSLSCLDSKYDSVFSRVRDGFKIYNDELINQRLEKLIRESNYVFHNTLPFFYGSKLIIVPGDDFIRSELVIPRVVDNLSHIFLGHEFHHLLKDINPEERKLRDRFAEVIPLFFELVNVDNEKVEEIKSEIIKRRLALLVSDKEALFQENCSIDRCVQYFNSFYYALCLRSVYRENPEKVLMLVSKVLNHVINTQELLQLLNIYDASLDNVVEDEYNDLKKKIIVSK